MFLTVLTGGYCWSILCQFCTFRSHFFKDHCSTIVPSVCMSTKWSFTFWFSNKFSSTKFLYLTLEDSCTTVLPHFRMYPLVCKCCLILLDVLGFIHVVTSGYASSVVYFFARCVPQNSWNTHFL